MSGDVFVPVRSDSGAQERFVSHTAVSSLVTRTMICEIAGGIW